MHPTPRPSPEPKPREPLRLPVQAQIARRRWPWIVALIVLVAGAYWLRTRSTGEAPGGAQHAPPAVPIVAATARTGDLPVYLTGLGNVVAYNTVTVKSRVDGQIVKIAFREGDLVHEGDVLAEIDPRPFEVQLAQAQGQLVRDKAQLRDAQLTAARFQDLFKQHVVSQQEVDDQVAKVGQFEGAALADQALIDNAKLQLTYAHVTAPISGRVGLRRVDVGNVVHANDATGFVVITQLQPISVIFTLPEDNLPPVMKKMYAGEPLKVEAYDRAGKRLIATGTLLTADNQIDTATGTTRLKSTFANDDGALFPNQFVNVRLLLDVETDRVIAPVAAIQRGPQGTFAYVVKPDQTVEVRPITVGPTTGDNAAIESGLAANEQVVVDGADKLRAGSLVRVRTAGEGEGSSPKPGA